MGDSDREGHYRAAVKERHHWYKLDDKDVSSPDAIELFIYIFLVCQCVMLFNNHFAYAFLNISLLRQPGLLMKKA